MLKLWQFEHFFQSFHLLNRALVSRVNYFCHIIPTGHFQELFQVLPIIFLQHYITLFGCKSEENMATKCCFSSEEHTIIPRISACRYLCACSLHLRFFAQRLGWSEMPRLFNRNWTAMFVFFITRENLLPFCSLKLNISVSNNGICCWLNFWLNTTTTSSRSIITQSFGHKSCFERCLKNKCNFFSVFQYFLEQRIFFESKSWEELRNAPVFALIYDKQIRKTNYCHSFLRLHFWQVIKL